MIMGVACMLNSTLKQTEKEKSYDKKTSKIERNGMHAFAGEINSILIEKSRDKINAFEKFNQGVGNVKETGGMIEESCKEYCIREERV